MPTEVWVPRLGLVTFSDLMTRDEQEQAMCRLCLAPIDERRALVQPFSFEDGTGACAEGLEYLDAPLSDVDAGRLMAAAQQRFRANVQWRAKWFRQNGGYLTAPNTPTAWRTCLSCGDPLPPGLLFGRCAPCASALLAWSMEAESALPDRQCQ